MKGNSMLSGVNNKFDATVLNIQKAAFVAGQCNKVKKLLHTISLTAGILVLVSCAPTWSGLAAEPGSVA